MKGKYLCDFGEELKSKKKFFIFIDSFEYFSNNVGIKPLWPLLLVILFFSSKLPTIRIYASLVSVFWANQKCTWKKLYFLIIRIITIVEFQINKNIWGGTKLIVFQTELLENGFLIPMQKYSGSLCVFAGKNIFSIFVWFFMVRDWH